jgi:hypothetical protein
MPQTYTPKYNYYVGDRSSFQKVIHILEVKDACINLYTFYASKNINLEDPNYNFVSANSFFGKPIPPNEKNDMNTVEFCGQVEKTNLIRFQDIIDYGFKYHENPHSPIDTSTLCLSPKWAVTFNANRGPKIANFESNVDFNIYTLNNEGNYFFENMSDATKKDCDPILNFKKFDVFCMNSGMGNVSKYTDLNILISSSVGNFFSNIQFTPDLTKEENGVYTFPNRLKLKLDGPSSCNVGDVLEYSVTLMNNDFSDTWTNPPDIAVYPVADAGNQSHRKLILKNGVGNFKVDTTNLYSGDEFDVKIGWKYITSDSKISVTVG